MPPLYQDSLDKDAAEVAPFGPLTEKSVNPWLRFIAIILIKREYEMKSGTRFMITYYKNHRAQPR